MRYISGGCRQTHEGKTRRVGVNTRVQGNIKVMVGSIPDGRKVLHQASSDVEAAPIRAWVAARTQYPTGSRTALNPAVASSAKSDPVMKTSRWRWIADRTVVVRLSRAAFCASKRQHTLRGQHAWTVSKGDASRVLPSSWGCPAIKQWSEISLRMSPTQCGVGGRAQGVLRESCQVRPSIEWAHALRRDWPLMGSDHRPGFVMPNISRRVCYQRHVHDYGDAGLEGCV